VRAGKVTFLSSAGVSVVSHYRKEVVGEVDAMSQMVSGAAAAETDGLVAVAAQS
jgi:hypothetical protein